MPTTTGTTPPSSDPSLIQERNSGQKVAITSPLQVDVFDPGRQPLNRWLQRLQGAFRVFQITEDATDKVAYLLHFVGVEAFGILCDRLDPADPYSQTHNTLVERLKEFYAPEPLEIAKIYVYRKRMQRAEESAQEYTTVFKK